ncbi:MAG: DUF128 domain-containing protein, partial [Synergistales bacterium]|nr:DUF128 domain-containing protein [Synergistales bacterium]
TEKGIEEAKMLFVFDRIGLASLETQKLHYECDYELGGDSGRVVVNLLCLPEERLSEALCELVPVSASGLTVSPLVGMVRSGGRVGNIRIPQGHVGLVAISSSTLDALFKREGIFVETSSTGLLVVDGHEVMGFTELICHAGTTLSPGELLVLGRYTRVERAVHDGHGAVTACIKTFPTFQCEQAGRLVERLERAGFTPVIDFGCVLPEQYRLDVHDRNKGYMLVYGGANLFAPLIELGYASEIHIATLLYNIGEMREPAVLLEEFDDGRSTETAGESGGGLT